MLYIFSISGCRSPRHRICFSSFYLPPCCRSDRDLLRSDRRCFFPVLRSRAEKRRWAGDCRETRAGGRNAAGRGEQGAGSAAGGRAGVGRRGVGKICGRSGRRHLPEKGRGTGVSAGKTPEPPQPSGPDGDCRNPWGTDGASDVAGNSREPSGRRENLWTVGASSGKIGKRPGSCRDDAGVCGNTAGVRPGARSGVAAFERGVSGLAVFRYGVENRRVMSDIVV